MKDSYAIGFSVYSLIADTLHSLEKKIEEKDQLLVVLIFSIINRYEISICQMDKLIGYIKLFLIK